MKEFIGLDLGKDTSTSAVLDATGRVIERESLEMSRRALHRYFLQKQGARLLLEVGCESAWVSRVAEAAGMEVRCVNPRKLKMVAETTLKTDELDAEVLARLCRISSMDESLLPSVRHRSEITQLERSVLVIRANMVRARTLFINTARGLARTAGYPLPSCAARTFVARARKAKMPPKVRAILIPMLDSIEQLNASIEKQDQEAARIGERHPIVQHLMSIDGVGPVVALWFVLCIEDPHRFQRARDVGAYFGFRPRLRQSSSLHRTGSITKEGDPEMRRLLTQAAHCLLTCKRSSALKHWADRLVHRVGRKKAIPAIARKLSVVMLRVWQTGEVYERFPDQVGLAKATTPA
jgi:transposase